MTIIYIYCFYMILFQSCWQTQILIYIIHISKICHQASTIRIWFYLTSGFLFIFPFFFVLLNIAPRSYRFCFASKDFSVTFQQFLVTSNLNPPPLNLSGSCSFYRAYFLHQSFHSYSSFIHATDTKLLPLNRFNHENCPCNQYIKWFHIAGQ